MGHTPVRAVATDTPTTGDGLAEADQLADRRVAQAALRLAQVRLSWPAEPNGPWCAAPRNAVHMPQVDGMLDDVEARMSSPALVGRASQLSALESALAGRAAARLRT